MDQGGLVSDEIVIGMIKAELETNAECKGGLVFSPTFCKLDTDPRYTVSFLMDFPELLYRPNDWTACWQSVNNDYNMQLSFKSMIAFSLHG